MLLRHYVTIFGIFDYATPYESHYAIDYDIIYVILRYDTYRPPRIIDTPFRHD